MVITTAVPNTLQTPKLPADRFQNLFLDITHRLDPVLDNRTLKKLFMIMESKGLDPGYLDLFSASTDDVCIILIHRLMKSPFADFYLDHCGDKLFAVTDCVVCALAAVWKVRGQLTCGVLR